MDGKLVALDKKTGEEVWVRDLSVYSWSSPVDFMSSDGKTYVLFCDANGDMHLIDPKTGRILMWYHWEQISNPRRLFTAIWPWWVPTLRRYSAYALNNAGNSSMSLRGGKADEAIS